MKAGAAYIPCDPHYPVDRIKLILEDSEAAYIVSDEENLENLKAQAGEGSLEVLEKSLNIEELLQCENTSNPAIPQDGSDLAFTPYTSLTDPVVSKLEQDIIGSTTGVCATSSLLIR